MRQQVHAVELRVLGLDARGGQRRRLEVELDHRLVVGLAGGKRALPLHQVRHADAAFPGLGLVAAEKAVARAIDRRAAVVADEEDQRVLGQLRLVELLQHGADRRRPWPTSSRSRSAAARPRTSLNRARYLSVACIGVWTALNVRYRKNGSLACRSMKRRRLAGERVGRVGLVLGHDFQAAVASGRRSGGSPWIGKYERAPPRKPKILLKPAVERMELLGRRPGATCRPCRSRSRRPSAGRRSVVSVSGRPIVAHAVGGPGLNSCPNRCW